MSAIDELTDLVTSAMEIAGSSVVSIGRRGRGTGFVVAPGRVVTNAHNLRDRTTQVRFVDGRTTQGTVMGSDVDGDIVVLEVDTGDAVPLEWAESAVRAGDVVVATTAGRNQHRATWGQVTAADRGFRGPRGRKISGAIEHTAPAPPGSSGAPVLNRELQVVGLNTHRIEHGFYLARAADDELRQRVTAMGEGQQFERLEFGVAIAPAHVAARLRRAVGLPERDGLLVHGIVEDSPAAAAGIQKGDLLVRAGDRELSSFDDLVAALDGIASGDELSIGLIRGTDELTVTATFAVQ